MCISLSHDRGFVPRETLDFVKVHTIPGNPGRKDMPEVVKPEILDPGSLQGRKKRPVRIEDCSR